MKKQMNFLELTNMGGSKLEWASKAIMEAAMNF